MLGGPLRVPGARLVIAAGDMSYALYLLHVPIAWFWLWLWARLPGFSPGPWDYLASALVVWRTPWSPLWVMAGGGLAGLLLG